MKKQLLVLIFTGSFFAAVAQDKCIEAIAVLDKVKDACERFPAAAHCNVFVGRAVKEMYGIDDFVNSAGPSGFLLANQVVSKLFIELSDKWENLGACDSQDALDSAQAAANSNRCVIAAWQNPDNAQPGHVALILPGQQKKGWVNAQLLPNGMMVPNAANFAQGAPNQNFICDRLSGAFGFSKRSAVFLFVRKDR